MGKCLPRIRLVVLLVLGVHVTWPPMCYSESAVSAGIQSMGVGVAWSSFPPRDAIQLRLSVKRRAGRVCYKDLGTISPSDDRAAIDRGKHSGVAAVIVVGAITSSPDDGSKSVVIGGIIDVIALPSERLIGRIPFRLRPAGPAELPQFVDALAQAEGTIASAR